jgi:hypothetical protein
VLPGVLWPGYRQFCQQFVFPLLLKAYRDIAFQPLLRGAVEGIEPLQCWNMMSLRDLLRPGVLMHVFLHARLQNTPRAAPRRLEAGPQLGNSAVGLIRTNVRKLHKLLTSLNDDFPPSRWSEYGAMTHYTDADRQQKRDFVTRVVGHRRRRLVWDLGCNAGDFSRIAAENSDSVVAFDSDETVVDRLYRSLKADGPGNILPLVMNLADPSPGLGWRGIERRSLGNRGRPELALCLALLHHLVIGHSIPLPEVLDWLMTLAGELVIEFASETDPLVRAMLKNKTGACDYSLDLFESELARRCVVSQRIVLPSGTRTLFHVQVQP